MDVIKEHRKITTRRFFTIGPYEKDEEFKALLSSLTQRGLFIAGLLGAGLVTIYVAAHIFVQGKTMIWTYSDINLSQEIVMLDKSAIFGFSLLTILLSRFPLSLKIGRTIMFLLIWTICFAMLMDDIIGGNLSMAPLYIALILAIGTIPFTAWQAALLSVTVTITTVLTVKFTPVLTGLDGAALSPAEVIYLFMMAFLLTGMSSQLYHNRYFQHLEHKKSELLSKKLEERANVLEKMKEKSEKQTEQLLENEELKNRFFANISHEFRTPLTVILGPLKDLTQKKNSSAFQEISTETLSIMYRNGRRLLDYINQLLDLSKTDAGEITLELQPVNFNGFLRDLVISYAPFAESKKVTLKFTDQDSPVFARIDPAQMEKVVRNLVSNAIKFTSEDGTITVNLSRPDAVENSVRISVTDTGVGIQEEDLNNVFDRFYQVKQPAGIYNEGTGVGLALAKEIIDLHQGEIWVESIPGKGSSFFVKLFNVSDTSEEDIPEYSTTPAEWADQESEVFDEADPLTAPEDAPVVVLIDDNPDILAYLKPRLAEMYRIVAFSSSSEALEYIQSNEVALVVSDIMMPAPDGFEVCKTIKQNPDLSHLPVILLTAQTAEEDKLEGLGLGADDYIGKPFSASELLARVENLIELRKKLREKFSEQVQISGTEIQVDSEDARFLQKVQEAIEEHMSNSNFGVDWLADKVNLSTRQLQRKIKPITNLSAGGYIRLIRLERASRLLEQKWGNVSEVCYEVGFQDTKYFSRLFKQTFGKTPSEFSEEA